MKTQKALLFSLACLVSMNGFSAANPEIPDAPTVYPEGELGRMVKLGEDIIFNTNTHDLTKDMVGNDLTCSNCHLQGGKGKTLGTFIGTATAFPAYSPREKTVQTLQNRINNCFMRSMNGKRPIIDTEASIAMTTYVSWLSSGLPVTMNSKKPVNPFYTKEWWGKKWVLPMIKAATHDNYVNGQKLYTEKCASCHQPDGQGLAAAKFPPVWGERSYNTGAGLSKPEKLPTYLLHNMPLGNANLTREEAVDISIYVDAQPRPDFDLQKSLYPREEMGHYNSIVMEEKHSVRSNFAKWGLDIDQIRGDKAIP
ncbi:c-type cytochrome [Amphritea sp. HPY]|uniref:c-type cytochrome n=1 Tax=Amphritea sp. HPY TaxID=3421652 RepID=UPI003D7D3C3C